MTDFFFFAFSPAPLNLNPISELERIVNDLRIKYRTYTVELNSINVSNFFTKGLSLKKHTIRIFYSSHLSCFCLILGHGCFTQYVWP